MTLCRTLHLKACRSILTLQERTNCECASLGTLQGPGSPRIPMRAGAKCSRRLGCFARKTSNGNVQIYVNQQGGTDRLRPKHYLPLKLQSLR